MAEILTKEQVYDLIIRSQNGDRKATETIVMRNQGLVVDICKKYFEQAKSRVYSRCLEISDLISEANMNLIYCIEKFDTTKDVSFSTYATFYIKQSCLRCLSKNTNLRMSVHTNDLRKRYEVAKNYLSRENKNVSFDEVCDFLQISKRKRSNLKNCFNNTVSLNMNIDTDGDGTTTLIDIIADPITESSETECINKLTEEQAIKCMHDFTERDKLIVSMRYGLNGYSASSLEEIGTKFGVTRERIRQILLKTDRIIRNRLEKIRY